MSRMGSRKVVVDFLLNSGFGLGFTDFSNNPGIEKGQNVISLLKETQNAKSSTTS